MNPDYLLIIQDRDYAYEFDVESFSVETYKEFEKRLKEIKAEFKKRPEQEHWFGTNEALMFEGFDDWYKSLKIKPITKEEYDTIIKLFEDSEFGTHRGFMDFCDWLEDE